MYINKIEIQSNLFPLILGMNMKNTSQYFWLTNKLTLWSRAWLGIACCPSLINLTLKLGLLQYWVRWRAAASAGSTAAAWQPTGSSSVALVAWQSFNRWESMAKKVGELGGSAERRRLRRRRAARRPAAWRQRWRRQRLRRTLGGEPRSRTSCRSPQGVPGSFPWPTIPQHYDEFHDIFRRRSLFSQQ